MNERQPPALPDGMPADLRDFIECRTASVTLPLGKIEWLPVPGADVTLAQGATPDSANINIDLGFISIALPISVVDGQLSVDSTGLPDMLGDAGTALQDWIRDLNDWLASHGRRFGPATIKDGVVTLVKESIPAGGAVQPTPPVPPPVVPPPPPDGPTQPPPPAGQPKGDGGGCLKWLGLALVLLLGAGIAYIGLDMLDGPGAGPSPSPTAPSVASTALPASPTVAPAPSATGTSIGPPIGTPTTSPTGSPAAGVSSPSPAPVEEFDPQPALNLLEEAGLPVPASEFDPVADAPGDLFLPDTGAPAPESNAWVDLTGAGAFIAQLDATRAERLSEWQCGSESQFDEWLLRVACNQDAPLLPGGYVIVATTWAADLPDPFVADSLCSYSVQTDTDGDPMTGFQSDLPFNYLTGADRYHEMLVFVSRDEFRNYVLATDFGRPPRADTGEMQGNLPTIGRAFWWPGEALMLWVIPQANFGRNWNVGAFCTGPARIAVDSLGHPDQPGFRGYRDLGGK